MEAAIEEMPIVPVSARYSLWQLVRYMLELGTWGFGGPVALIGYMYRDLVEKRGWITESDYKEGLALAQLMPGPLAAQLSIYLGFVHYRVVGATLVGIAFVLPSFVMVVALGALYVAYGGIDWMQAVFYGVGAAVIGIIALSAYKLTTRNIGKDKCSGQSSWSARRSRSSRSPRSSGSSSAAACWSGCGAHLRSPSAAE